MAQVQLLSHPKYGLYDTGLPETDPSRSAPPLSPGGATNKLGRPNTEPYTNWNDESNWFKKTVTPHVTSKPFLYGRVSDADIAEAFKVFNKYRENPAFNRGDAYNRTLDDL